MLFLSINDRMFYLKTAKRTREVLTDGMADVILSNMRPMLKSGKAMPHESALMPVPRRNEWNGGTYPPCWRSFQSFGTRGSMHVSPRRAYFAEGTFLGVVPKEKDTILGGPSDGAQLFLVRLAAPSWRVSPRSPSPCRATRSLPLAFQNGAAVFRVSAFPFFQRAFRPCLWAQRLGVRTTGLGGISWDNQTLAPLKGEPQGDWLNNGCSFFPGLPSTCLRRFHCLRCHLLCAMRSLLLIVTRRLASRFVQLGAPLHWRVLCLVYPGACLLLPFASVHCFLHARPSHAASRLRPVRGPFLSLRGHL